MVGSPLQERLNEMMRISSNLIKVLGSKYSLEHVTLNFLERICRLFGSHEARKSSLYNCD